MMEYKGYFAQVEFDDADIFHGEVINLALYGFQTVSVAVDRGGIP